MAVNYNVNPLGGFNLGQGISQVFGGYQQGQEKERLEAQREQLQQAALGAAKGDPQAIEQLFALDPKMAMMFESRQAQMSSQEAAAKDQAFADWGLKYAAAKTPEEKQALEQEALSNPMIDFDESDIALTQGQKDLVVNAALFKNLGKDRYQQFFQGGVDPAKAQELELKKEANELRRMEVEQRVLDRQLSKETNELKKQELQGKIEKAKAEAESKKREVSAAADSAITSIDNSLSTIDRIRKSPGFSSAVGARIPFLDQLPGSDAQETIGLIETLQSQTFLAEVGKMKGMGALSENEGKKLSAAIGSLNRDMSEKGFRKSLDEIESYLSKARKVALEKYGRSPETEAPAVQAPQAAIDYLRQNPQFKQQFQEKYGYLPEGI